jgi:ABC-2 type transport system permease protein
MRTGRPSPAARWREPRSLVRNTLTIAGREVRSYFSSPVAYVLLAVYLALAGYFFFALLSAFNQTLTIYSMMRNPEMLQRFNLNEMVLQPLLHNMSVLLIFIIPAITMRMFPEEKSAGTYELLLTSPVRVSEIVLGKFLGGLSLVLLMVLLSGFFGALLVAYGNPEGAMMLTGYLGLALMALSFLTIGTLVSSFTDNVVIAYTGALFALLLLYTIGWLGESVHGAWGDLVKYVSITDHFQQLLKGLVDTTDLVYFATILVIGLFLTHRSVESVRWR